MPAWSSYSVCVKSEPQAGAAARRVRRPAAPARATRRARWSRRPAGRARLRAARPAPRPGSWCTGTAAPAAGLGPRRAPSPRCAPAGCWRRPGCRRCRHGRRPPPRSLRRRRQRNGLGMPRIGIGRDHADPFAGPGPAARHACPRMEVVARTPVWRSIEAVSARSCSKPMPAPLLPFQTSRSGFAWDKQLRRREQAFGGVGVGGWVAAAEHRRAREMRRHLRQLAQHAERDALDHGVARGRDGADEVAVTFEPLRSVHGVLPQ